MWNLLFEDQFKQPMCAVLTKEHREEIMLYLWVENEVRILYLYRKEICLIRPLLQTLDMNSSLTFTWGCCWKQLLYCMMQQNCFSMLLDWLCVYFYIFYRPYLHLLNLMDTWYISVCVLLYWSTGDSIQCLFHCVQSGTKCFCHDVWLMKILGVEGEQ